MGRRGHFLVVVLVLTVEKAIEHEDENDNDNGKRGRDVIFGSGYSELGTWWKLGALTSVINILLWLLVGGLWWKHLGL
jgi:Sodium:sulfate symporter transmembrane region